MTLKDHRLLTGVEYLDNNNYLLAIGQLVYHVKLDVKVYEPIYRSDDLCGKVSTLMIHNKLGKMMICGGQSQLTVFTSDSNGYIDLSQPRSNVFIDSMSQNELKNIKIMNLVSGRMHPNHFALVSEIQDVPTENQQSFVSSSQQQTLNRDTKTKRKPNETRFV